MYSLNLLRLLAQNRLADLHAELELVPSTVRESKLVQFVLELERVILEGNYHRVRLAAKDMPDPSFGFFMRLLVPTVQQEIAACVAAAYDSLTKKALADMLMLDSVTQLAQFIDNNDAWRDDGARVVFERTDERTANDVTRVAPQLVHQQVEYARSVERIV